MQNISVFSGNNTPLMVVNNTDIVHETVYAIFNDRSDYTYKFLSYNTSFVVFSNKRI
jgi:hypothetical protein